MAKLSMVVPIYGVEKYINRFLDSLTTNLIPGVEVILVDDGTKDNSGRIADEYADKNKEFVKVIHKENGGLSSARNAGMKVATGEYILFPDPDDYLAEGYVKEIFNAIEKYNHPDLIFFDYFKLYEVFDKEYLKLNTVPHFKDGWIKKDIFLKEFAKDDYIKSMVWCKAIKKSFYEGFEFNVNTRVAEDFEVLTDLVLNVEKIVYLKKALYYYFSRESSLTHTASVKDAEKFFELLMDRYAKYSMLYDDLGIRLMIRAAHGVLSKAYTLSADIKTGKYEDIINNNVRNILCSKEFSLNHKKQCLFVYWGIAKYYYRAKGILRKYILGKPVR